VRTTVPLDLPGKQFGQILVPDSRNDAAWAHVAVPFAVIANGEGRTALIFGGNHGDEYEGQIALLNLAREIQADQVSGRIILVPRLSVSASSAGTRLWPSGVNLNRSFPGSPTGTPEEVLADYITRYLIPISDVVFDIHSGGRTLRFVPMTVMDRIADPDQRAAIVETMLAWNTTYHMSGVNAGGSGFLPWEVERQGKLLVTTELGGGGFLPREVIALAESGVKNVLRHLQILEGEVETRVSLGLDEVVQLTTRGYENYVVAPLGGFFEPRVDLGEAVEESQEIGRLLFPERPDAEPTVLHAPMRGRVVAIKSLPPTRQGDVVALIAEPES
jgi:predicted deacylase